MDADLRTSAPAPQRGASAPWWVWFLAVFAVLLVGVAVGREAQDDCISDPSPQLRLGDVTYLYRGDAAVFRADELGPPLGTIEGGLPSAATSCDSYVLADRHGTPPVASSVHEIPGIDPTVAVAALLGSSYVRFDASPSAG